MNQLGPGLATHVYDYSADPRLLLGSLAAPIRRLSNPGTPVVHVRRGWLHGSHLVVTARPLRGVPVDLDAFTANAGDLASRLDASPPSEQAYLARAEQLAVSENVSAPPLPLYPQGFTTVGTPSRPEGWSDQLLDTRDLLTSALLEPVLDSTALAPEALLPHAARVLALAALAHPFGIGIATLSMRSHTEGIWSATGGTLDLRTEFTERFERDRDLFLAAFSGLTAAGLADDEAALLRSWDRALHRCRGTAAALTAVGAVDETHLSAASLREAPLSNGVPSPFHRAARLLGVGGDEPQPYWHIAQRMVLNVLYSAFSCLGISPIQRYYLCFGTSMAADALLGEDWSERLEQVGRLVRNNLAATG